MEADLVDLNVRIKYENEMRELGKEELRKLEKIQKEYTCERA